MDCGPPGSSVPGILQARILEWVAVPFSGDLSALHINFPFPLKGILQKIEKNVPLVFKCSPSDEPKCTVFLPSGIP